MQAHVKSLCIASCAIATFKYVPELNRWWLIGESADIFCNVAASLGIINDWIPKLLVSYNIAKEDNFYNAKKLQLAVLQQVAISLLCSYLYTKIAGFMDLIVVLIKWPNVGTLCYLFEFLVAHPILCTYNYGKG